MTWRTASWARPPRPGAARPLLPESPEPPPGKVVSAVKVLEVEKHPDSPGGFQTSGSQTFHPKTTSVGKRPRGPATPPCCTQLTPRVPGHFSSEPLQFIMGGRAVGGGSYPEGLGCTWGAACPGCLPWLPPLELLGWGLSGEERPQPFMGSSRDRGKQDMKSAHPKHPFGEAEFPGVGLHPPLPWVRKDPSPRHQPISLQCLG